MEVLQEGWLVSLEAAIEGTGAGLRGKLWTPTAV